MEKQKTIDLRGSLCPLTVISIIEDVENLNKGEAIVFLIDDPLALKSAPEELEEYEVIHTATKCENYWEFKVEIKGEK